MTAMLDLPGHPVIDKTTLVGGCLRLTVRIDAQRLADEVAACRRRSEGSTGGQVGVHRNAEALFLRGYAPAQGALPIEDREPLALMPSARDHREADPGSAAAMFARASARRCLHRSAYRSRAVFRQDFAAAFSDRNARARAYDRGRANLSDAARRNLGNEQQLAARRVERRSGTLAHSHDLRLPAHARPAATLARATDVTDTTKRSIGISRHARDDRHPLGSSSCTYTSPAAPSSTPGLVRHIADARQIGYHLPRSTPPCVVLRAALAGTKAEPSGYLRLVVSAKALPATRPTRCFKRSARAGTLDFAGTIRNAVTT